MTAKPSSPLSLLFVFVLCTASMNSRAQATVPALPEASAQSQGMSPQRLQRMEDFMRKATAGDGYPGAVTLIARNGRIVDWRAQGFRDLARTQTMQRDSIFRIYSMTKTIASVAALVLVEEGKLALGDPVSRYLPEFSTPQVMTGGTAAAPQLRDASRPITIQHLLTHTAGFPAGLKGDDEAVKRLEQLDPHGASDLAGFSRRLAQVPLAADPGTRFGYDGAATEVLARVIEVASGMSFDRFLQTRILDPLGMRDTGFSVPAAQRGRVVDITTLGDDGRLRLDDGPSAITPGAPLNAYTSGAGGLYSTAGDYARFCQMLLDGGTLDGASILGRKTVELMLSNHLTMLERPVTQFSDAEGFGLGGYVVLDPARRGQPGSIGQFGWSGAASTTYTIDPKERLVAILMMQHIPRDGRKDDLPRISRNFYALAYQALVAETSP